LVKHSTKNQSLGKSKFKLKSLSCSLLPKHTILCGKPEYTKSKKVETVKSIPLYSIINGFWINETGNLEITIRYKPQDWFEIGLMISATTFIGCVGYLFYDWRKERGDEWTLRVENSVRRVMGRK